jgi:predicted RNase H-like HicB family nuclease
MKKYEMKISNFTVRFEPAAGGGYNIVVPAIPEIKAHCKTLKEARALANDVMERYIEALQANESTSINVGRLIDEAYANMILNSRYY